jgi:hypothetical protein
MSQRLSVFSVATTLLMLLVIGAGSASAQSIWTDRRPSLSATISFVKPALSDKFSDGVSVCAGSFSVRFRQSWISAVAELPYVRYSESQILFYSSPSTGLAGNLYLGFEIQPKEFPAFLEVGVRMPTAPEKGKCDARSLGQYADFDRLGTFAGKLITLSGMFNIETRSARKVYFRARAGVAWLTTTQEDGSNELAVQYGMVAGFENDRIRAIGGITGVIDATGDYGEHGDRLTHHIGLLFGYSFGFIQPALEFRVPLASNVVGELQDYIVGINLTFQAPRVKG